MSRSLRVLACVLLLAGGVSFFAMDLAAKVSSSRGKAGEWPQWRGPNRDGISQEKGLLKSWEQKAPELLWTGSGLGAGFSSVSIAENRIFTMGDRGDDQYVIALGLADGKELWSTKISKGWEKGGYAGPRCTPTADGEYVYAMGTHGDLVCLAAASGEVRWQKNMKSDFGGKMSTVWGYSESPLVDGDQLICTPGAANAMVVALNKADGEEIWRCAVPELGSAGKEGAGYSSPVISEAQGIRQYVQLVGKGVIGVNAKDGKLLWSYNRVANNTANIPTAIVEGNYVFASTGYRDGGTALLNIVKRGKGLEANEVYYLPADEFQVHHGGMILLGKHIYAGHGHNNGFPTCLEFKTGKVVWGKKRGPGANSAAVAYADGNLYFRYQNGLMALIEATPQEYRLKGTFQIPDVSNPSWPHPVIAGGKLYLREQDALLCYNVQQ